MCVGKSSALRRSALVSPTYNILPEEGGSGIFRLGEPWSTTKAGEQRARISSRLRPQIDALEVKQTGQGLRPLMEWYFATADRDEALKRWDKFDVSQQREMISAHLGQQGFIRVDKKKNRSRSVEPETIKIRWSLGDEAAMPPDLVAD